MRVRGDRSEKFIEFGRPDLPQSGGQVSVLLIFTGALIDQFRASDEEYQKLRLLGNAVMRGLKAQLCICEQNSLWPR